MRSPTDSRLVSHCVLNFFEIPDRCVKSMLLHRSARKIPSKNLES
jgi:hypothetical protein